MKPEFNQIERILKNELEKNETKRKRFPMVFLLASLLIFLVSLYLLGAFPEQKTILAAKTVKKKSAQVKADILNFFPFVSEKESKNILLLGVPGPGNDAPDLTDTILVAKINYDPLTISLISIPRDLWVESPNQGIWTKINSLYILGKNQKNPEAGIALIKEKTEEIIGQKINNYVLIDLSVLKYLIDSQGGIALMVKEDIFDPTFPGPNHSFQTFEIKAGWRYFDGETALKYARTRHSPQGDFDRIERQQQVVEALKQKLAAMDMIGDLPKVLGILKELHSRVQTDIPWSEIPEYWQIFKGFSPEDMRNLVIEKENRLITSAGISIDGQPVSALAPAAGPENYSEIQKYINSQL